MTPGQRQPLPAAVHALQRGHWRHGHGVTTGSFTNWIDGCLDDGIEASRLAALVQLVADAMGAQAGGDPARSSIMLGQAATLLPAPQREADPDGSTRAVLVREPPASSGVRLWTWQMSQVIHREQQELERLRRRFLRTGRTPRDELVDAYIHWLMWVVCDPWTWYLAPDRPDLAARDRTSVELKRIDLVGRATNLRHFAIPTLCDVSESVWKDLGARRLITLALTRLGTEIELPWPEPNGMRADGPVPVRLGRTRAWEQARTWLADTTDTGN